MIDFILMIVGFILEVIPALIRWIYSGRKEPYEEFIKKHPRSWFDGQYVLSG